MSERASEWLNTVSATEAIFTARTVSEWWLNAVSATEAIFTARACIMHQTVKHSKTVDHSKTVTHSKTQSVQRSCFQKV